MTLPRRMCALMVALTAAAALTPFFGCNTNVAKTQAPVDTVALAQEDMEAGRYAEAQIKCEAHLEQSPDDHSVRSLLSAALAAQGGLVLIDILLKASAGQGSQGGDSESEGSTEGLASVSAFLPAATLANVAALFAANTHMALIPKASRTASMTLQASLFLLFESMLRLKYLQENPAALSSLTAADAKRIVASITEAATLSAGSSNPFAQVASSTSQSLSSMPGGTDKEKLTNYVAQIPLAETVALSKPLYEDAAESNLSKEER
ncbi:MAG: hypothetical protein IOD12_12075 [Silvanigrellales bacterium]|nr:hypothetical protein [Silvanigrellales bacterium]